MAVVGGVVAVVRLCGGDVIVPRSSGTPMWHGSVGACAVDLLELNGGAVREVANPSDVVMAIVRRVVNPSGCALTVARDVGRDLTAELRAGALCSVVCKT